MFVAKLKALSILSLPHSRVPPFLQSVEDPRAAQGGSLKGCPVCGGLGHAISNCPKLEDTQRRTMAAHRGGDDGGGY